MDTTTKNVNTPSLDILNYGQGGYDSDGYNRDGYNRDGYNRDGYNMDGYDRDGYDSDGYDCDGDDRDGYDRDGYDCDGYDRDGYDCDGYDRDGCNEDGEYRDHENGDGHVGGYKKLTRPGEVGYIDQSLPCLGFELEVVHEDYQEKADKVAGELVQRENFGENIIAEHDGSLDEGGIEFITGYGNWDSMKNVLEPFCKALKDNGFEESDCAGVHIHFSHRNMPTSVFRAAYWLVCCDKNKRLTSHVAGRYNTNFAQSNRSWYNGLQTDRYAALNNRGATWEFRMFESTTEFDTLSVYAEYCLAVVAYAKTLPDDVMSTTTSDNFETSQLSYTELLSFIRKDTVSYPNLIKHVRSL